MPAFGKYNPGTYWGKGFGLGDLGEIVDSPPAENDDSPLELIRFLSSPSSSSSSGLGSTWNEATSGGSGSSHISPASAALLSTALKQGANMAGFDPRVTSFIPAITSALSGDTSGALRNASGTATGVALNALNVPAPVIGPVASFVSSYAGGDDMEHIAKNVGNSIIGSTAAYLGGPVVGTLYTIARQLGFDPIRGIASMINPDTTNPESWQGGFFSRGYDTQPESYITSGNENYSPYGGAQYERVASSSSAQPYTPSNDTYFGGINTGGGNNYYVSSGSNTASSNTSSPTGWGGYSYSGVGSSGDSGAGDGSDGSDDSGGGW